MNITQAPKNYRSLPKHQIVITMIGVLLGMFMSSLDQTIVDTALPVMMSDLNSFHTTWVMAIYIIASAITVPIIGKLTDMFGRKPFYIGGIVIFTVASLLCGLSANMTQLLVFRGLQGIGAGSMMANSFIVISDIFPPAERGKYQGIISSVFAMSAIIGPSLGGFITDKLSWHWIFFVNVPLGVLIGALFLRFFPVVQPRTDTKVIDYAGIVSMTIGVGALLVALSLTGETLSWFSAPVIVLLVVFVVMLIAFIRIEARSRNPLLPLDIFRNRIVVISLIASFLTAFGMYAAITFVPLFYQGVLGASATASGGFLTPMLLGQVSGSFLSGQLLSRAGGHYRLQGLVGLLILGVGIALLTLINPTTSYFTVVVSIILTGFGIGTIFPLYTVAAQNAVPYKHLGVTTSSIPFIRSIGASVGLAIFSTTLIRTYSSKVMFGLPQEVKEALTTEQISALSSNSQILINVTEQEKILHILMDVYPHGEQLFEHLMQTLREALSSAIQAIFIIALIACALAILVHFCIKEIPLRKDHGHN